MSDLTAQQKSAVEGRGNLVVVAGAGTGKTQTLIARCLRLVVEEHVALERILLVTFTETAAAEMRGRLRQEMLALQAARPADEHLAKQLALLDTARISTLHSFCLQLVREHFYQLGLDPQFSVLDERQTAPLRRATLDEILEQHYSSTSAKSLAVQQFIRAAGQGSDKPVRELVMKLHDYAQSLPDPAGWRAAQEQRFAKNEPDEWRDLFVRAVQDWRDEWRAVLKDDPALDAVPAMKLARAALKALPEHPSLAEAGEAVRAVFAADAPAENWPRGSKGQVRDPNKGFFDDAKFLSGLAVSGNSDPLAEDWNWARGAMTALAGMVREFTAGFAARKRELAGVDFADLEQLVLRLLREPGVAAAWRSRLAHILVDEYQDINAVQDAIITAVARDDQDPNRFLVGDVKQSIYRFRRANPAIFQAYQARWPGRQPLTENFRARESLLDFVNAVCASLMRGEVGGVVYEPLVFGDPARRKELSARPGDKPSAELHLIAKAGDGDNGDEESAGEANGQPPDLLAVEREARLVARRLHELHERAHPVWDKEKNCFRAVKWSDMAVLLRSPAGRAEAFAIEFGKAGVPLSAARDGFFASLEVTDLLNLLRLLDNPLQDVPLVAVLRSPLAGWSPDELARLRAGSDVKPFWTLLRQVELPGSKIQNEDRALADRVKVFLAQFDHWRQLARQASLSQCLDAALNQTQYETLVLTGARGPERVANVRKLLDLARQFDPYQRQGLYRFLRFVQSQADEDLDLQPAPPMAEDAVRLLSMHRSKGLEFPVVALAGLGTTFNEQDLGAAVLVHESLGFCPRIMPPDAEQRYPGLTHWLARRAERRELRGEELRLLYVALTRARDALILVGTVNRLADDVRWESGVTSPVDTNAVLKARSQLDWLLAWLPRGTVEADWWAGRKGVNRLLEWKIYDGNDPHFAERPTVAEPEGAVARRDELLPADALPKLRARLKWDYPFLTTTVEPAKTTVSLLRRRLREETDDESRPLIRVNPPRNRASRSGGLSAARIGSAHHVFLQFASLEKLGHASEVKAEAERLRAEGLLSAEEMAALDLNALADFWQSPAGQRILAQRKNVHREIPFTARFTPADLAAAGVALNISEAEFVVVQGVVDLAVILPGEIRLVDFKTDDVTQDELPARVKLYEPQLKLYAHALRRIYQREVTEGCLHFLSRRMTVAVKI